MKCFNRFFALFVSLFFINNCDNPVNSNDYDSYFPLSVGNQWRYERSVVIFNVRSDSSVSIDTTAVTYPVNVEIIKTDSLNNTPETFVFLEIAQGPASHNYSAISYYANQDSGLYLYAYKGGNTTLPKPSTNYNAHFNNTYLGTVPQNAPLFGSGIFSKAVLSDSVMYEEPPAKVLAYPLSVGVQWVYRDAWTIFTLYRKVISKETVQVPAGNFECYKIQYIFDVKDDINRDIEFISYDYINKTGLIKRSIIYKNLQILDEQGNKLALADLKNETVLTNYTLK